MGIEKERRRDKKRRGHREYDDNLRMRAAEAKTSDERRRQWRVTRGIRVSHIAMLTQYQGELEVGEACL